jgi:hypothetical protein
MRCYASLVIRELTAAAILVGILRGPGCGEVDSPENGANAPCTRDSDCVSSLVCAQGVCVSPEPPDSDASIDDASLGDAAADAIADAAGSDG